MIHEGLAFDDVLLVPEYSEVESRSKVDLSVKLGESYYDHPIIPANMKTVTGKEMAAKIAESKGLAILHRFMPIPEQVQIAESLINSFGNKHLAMSVGVKANDLEYVSAFYDVGVRKICIDIAHGDSKSCINMISAIKDKYPKVVVIAGNVATGTGAKRLWNAGADIVKVGVGPGSLCTTRIETGNGVPQLTALMDVFETRKLLSTTDTTRSYQIIADGGIKNVGDIVKALCFSDMVMIGNMFAGCDETPGNVINIDGRLYKEYVGSSTHKTNHIEGVAAMVPYKGSFDVILTKMIEGLKSGCSYQGAKNLVELKDNPVFIRMTSAGLRESHPHDVTMR